MNSRNKNNHFDSNFQLVEFSKNKVICDFGVDQTVFLILIHRIHITLGMIAMFMDSTYHQYVTQSSDSIVSTVI